MTNAATKTRTEIAEMLLGMVNYQDDAIRAYGSGDIDNATRNEAQVIASTLIESIWGTDVKDAVCESGEYPRGFDPKTAPVFAAHYLTGL